MTRLLVLSALALVGSGCGLAGSASCDFRTDAGNSSAHCQERVDTFATVAFKGTCEVAMGIAADGKCPRAGAVGGCDVGAQGDGSRINDWYYAPKTREEAQMKCMDDKGKFLEP